MKFLRHLLGWVLVLGAVTSVLWCSFELRERFSPAEHEEEAKVGDEAKKPEHEGLQLDEEARKRLGLATAELVTAEWRPQIAAYGEVLNLLPYHELENELTIAQATVGITKRTLERAKALKSAGDLAEKDFDAAESAAREGDLKLQAIQRRITAEWGEAVKSPVTAATVLMRVEVPASVVEKDVASVLSVRVSGREWEGAAASLFPAPTIDPKTQMPAFIIRFESAGALPPVGAAVTAMLSTDGEALKGVLIPTDAVVHFNGLAWVFVEEKEGEYERRAVPMDRPLPGGWFVEDDFEPGDKVVTTGAVHLLAVENKTLLGEKD